MTAAPWSSQHWPRGLATVLDPLGVRSVLATSAREAEHAIRQRPIHIAVVDLSVPLEPAPPGAPTTTQLEEAGTRILELLRRLDEPPPTVVIKTTRSSRDNARHLVAALRCNAFAVVDRNAADLETMLQVLHRCLLRFYADRWPATPPKPTTASS